MTEDLSPLWSALLDLQQLTDSARISARSHAADEAFAAVLGEIDPDVDPPSPDAVRQRFSNLISNRAKKFRARSAAEAQLVHHEQMHRYRADAHAATLYRQMTATALSTLKGTDAAALTDVCGEGLEYHELAAKLLKPIGTLKAIVSRARRQVRESFELRHIVDVLRAA
jgi:DNA-directed RNA polymerase specialized sigma24 family protein